MPKGTTFDNDWLKLTFTATPIANIADNAASAPLTNLYVSLHTADPTAAGNQGTSEVAYSGYTRVMVARTAAGWIVTGNSVSPASNISFPVGTGGSGTVTNWAVGTAVSGTGKLLYTGTVNPTIACGNGIQPVLTTASTITES